VEILLGFDVEGVYVVLVTNKPVRGSFSCVLLILFSALDKVVVWVVVGLGSIFAGLRFTDKDARVGSGCYRNV
jgi:hypothetical protein